MKILIKYCLTTIFSILFSINFSNSSYQKSPSDEDLIKSFEVHTRAEGRNLLRKLHLRTNVEIINEGQTDARVSCDLAKSSKDLIELTYELKHRGKMTYHSPKLDLYIDNIEAKKKHHEGRKTFLRIALTAHHNRIHIQSQRWLAFPQRLGEFNFIPQLFSRSADPRMEIFNPTPTQELPADHPHGKLSDQFKKDFDGNLHFLALTMAHQEGIEPAVALYEQRQRLYNQYCLEKLFFDNKDLSHKNHHKIPQIIHNIWFTSSLNPVEPPERYIHWMLDAEQTNPNKHGWRHILWVHDKRDLPKTMERLEGRGIEVLEIGDFEGAFSHIQIVLKEIEARKFGKASDVFRYMVLKKMGGIYKDTDYRLMQSCNVLTRLYDFFVGVEPMSNFIGNAFIASKPNHPVISGVLDLVVRNYDRHKSPKYIAAIPDNDGFKTILLTGPSALTTAVYKYGGRPGNVDIIFPPKFLYPTKVDSYPQKEIVKPDDPIPAESLGAHFWETSWFNVIFNSEG